MTPEGGPVRSTFPSPGHPTILHGPAHEAGVRAAAGGRNYSTMKFLGTATRARRVANPRGRVHPPWGVRKGRCDRASGPHDELPLSACQAPRKQNQAMARAATFSLLPWNASACVGT